MWCHHIVVLLAWRAAGAGRLVASAGRARRARLPRAQAIAVQLVEHRRQRGLQGLHQQLVLVGIAHGDARTPYRDR